MSSFRERNDRKTGKKQSFQKRGEGRLDRPQTSATQGRGGGENVARGQKNLNEVLTTWLNSPMHCANIMNPKFTDYAVACTFDSTEKQKPYWAQQFGIR